VPRGIESTYEMKHTFSLAVMFLSLVLFSGFAMAQEEDDGVDPEKVDQSCQKVVSDIAKSAANNAKNNIIENASALVTDFGGMRAGCSGLRTCKKDCRKGKRAAIKECRKLKGAEKRACKKEARKAKGTCKTTCRGQLEMAECKAGRKQFWGRVGNLLKSAATTALRSKVESLSVICVPVYENSNG